MRAELYQGQVPHPEHAERYEALLPGCTDRFVSMAERQGEHRQRMEWTFLRFNGVSQVLGVIFAGLAILGGIGGGIFLLYHDKNLSGFGALLTPLATVGSIFLLERKSQKAEVEGKRRAERR